MLEKAIQTAAKAHQGQLDKAGQPYILHPLRVMISCKTDTDKVCAVLHDVVKDTSITLDDLKNEGFSDEVIEVIDLLTKKPDENYESFIERICNNEVACRVKIADLHDNMDLSRIENPTSEDKKRVEKYLDAIEKIYSVLYPDRDDFENRYEIEINGCVTLPKLVSEDEFNDKFISFLELNHWYFGGGINVVEEEQ